MSDQKQEIRALRELLAVTYCGFGLYHDDGELQDNTSIPCIDFKRDTVAEIKAKMRERSLRRLQQSDNSCTSTSPIASSTN